MSWRCSPRTRIRPPRRTGCRLAQVAVFPRVHDVCCCLGTTMKQAGSPDAFRKVGFSCVVELARVAVRHRPSQFLVVTAVGADPQSRILYSRVKGEAEEAVRRLQFEGMQIFRPSLLVGARAQSRPAERVAGLLSMLVAWAFVGPLARYRPIKAETVARAMVRVAREAPRGTHVYESEDIRRRAADPRSSPTPCPGWAAASCAPPQRVAWC